MYQYCTEKKAIMDVQQLLDLLDGNRVGVARARKSSTLQLNQLTSKYTLSSETATNTLNHPVLNHPVLAIPLGMVAGKQLEAMRRALLLPFVSLNKLSVP